MLDFVVKPVDIMNIPMDNPMFKYGILSTHFVVRSKDRYYLHKLYP